MSDYYGEVTLEDWLKEEVFLTNNDIPTHIVEKFNKWRGDVEYNIRAWMDTSEEDGNGGRSWRGWGRGFNAIGDDELDNFRQACDFGEGELRKIYGKYKEDAPRRVDIHCLLSGR